VTSNMQMMTQFHMTIRIPTGGYSLPSQLIKILHVMIIFFVWIERCEAHIDKCHSIKSLLKNSWTTTIKMGIAVWTVIMKHKVVHDPNKQKNMEVAFWKSGPRIWCLLILLLMSSNGITCLILLFLALVLFN
jgi:hypothetical protein